MSRDITHAHGMLMASFMSIDPETHKGIHLHGQKVTYWAPGSNSVEQIMMEDGNVTATAENDDIFIGCAGFQHARPIDFAPRKTE